MAEQRDNEQLIPAIKALTALANLGLDESVLMQALVSEDHKALDEIYKKIATAENRKEILVQLRHASEAMQAEVGAVGSAEATQLKQVIVNELTQQEATAPVEPPVEPPVERWEIVGEDRVAIAAEEASRQRAAIANLTQAETVPAITVGASEPWHSAFELLTVSGADGESINTYLAEQARARGKKSVVEIRNDEFREIVNDTKSFQQWSARRWVDQFINQRKDEMRQLAEEKTAVTTRRSGRYSTNQIDPVLNSPLAGKLKEDRTALNTAQSELAARRRTDASNLQTTQTELQEQQVAALVTFRSQLESRRLDSTMIEALVAKQRGLFENIRQQIQETKQAASMAFIEQAEAELQKRKAELDQLAVETRYAVTTGVKRELVLGADRWGRALGLAVKENPELMRKDETTGDISITADVMADKPKVLQALVDQLGKEVDRVFEAKTAGGEKANRVHNLEAIITSPVEAEIAEQYLKQLLEIYAKPSGRTRSDAESNKQAALQKHDLVWAFLLDKKFATTEHELRALPVYKDANRALPSALPVLAEQYGQEIDGDNHWLSHRHAARQVDLLLEARVKQVKDDSLLHESFMEGLQKMAEVVGKPKVLSTNPDARNIADDILSTFERWRGSNIDNIKGAIYQSANKDEFVLWSKRDRAYVLAAVVVGDFAGRYNEVVNNSQDKLSDAAFGQIELNARSMAKTNRLEAKAWLDMVAAKVQESCTARMPDTGKTNSRFGGVDASQTVAAWKAKAEQVSAIVKFMETRLGRIATLKANI